MTGEAPPAPTPEGMGPFDRYDENTGLWLQGRPSLHVENNNNPTISPTITVNPRIIGNEMHGVTSNIGMLPETPPEPRRIEVTVPPEPTVVSPEPTPITPEPVVITPEPITITPEPVPPAPGETPPTTEPGKTGELTPANLAEQLAPLLEPLLEQIKQQQELIEKLVKRLDTIDRRTKKTPNDKKKADDKPKDPDDKPEGEPTDQEKAAQALDEARDALVAVVIRRRARSSDKLTSNARADAAEYDTAFTAYKEALDKFFTVREADLTKGEPAAEGEEAKELTPEEIRARLTKEMFEEQRQLIKREQAMNNELLDKISQGGEGFFGKIWAKRADVIRSYANMSTGKKLLLLGGVGLGVSIASSTLGLGLAGMGAAAAYKFSMGVVGRKASARNISDKSTNREIADVDKAAAELPVLELEGDPDPDVAKYRGGLVDRVQSDLDGRIQSAQRRNKRGNFLMLLAGVPTIYGAAELAGALPAAPHFSELWGGSSGGGSGASVAGHHLATNPDHPYNPSTGTETTPYSPHGGSGAGIAGSGGEHLGSGGGGGSALSPGAEHTGSLGANSKIDFSHFRPDSFYGKTPHEAIQNMFGVLENNHIKVDGLTSDKINAIEQAMRSQHWDIAYGVNANGTQHLVDAAQGFSGNATPNATASALEGLQKINGSSVENWQRFADLARQQGVRLTQG